MTAAAPMTQNSKNAPATASRMIVVGLLPFDGDFASLTQAAGDVQLSRAAPAPQYLSPGMTRSLLGALAHQNHEASPPEISRSERLTSRERQVFDRISEGLSNKQIATRLGIAIHTVKCHVHNILAKLEVDNRVQVAVFGRSRQHAGWGPELMQS